MKVEGASREAAIDFARAAQEWLAAWNAHDLFKAFYRGSNVGTRPGTGLGLLLVKRCAALHGGKVQVNSKIGEGTTVPVRLPMFGVPPLGGAARVSPRTA